MQLRFTKGSGKFDRLDIIRAKGPAEHIDCPKQGIIPHDMVHYAVEHVLGAHGFLRRVAAGEAASFQMQPEEHSDGVERLVEVIQGDQWSGGHSSPEDLLALYQVTCDARHCPPLPIDAAAFLAIRREITDLSARWAALPVGGELTLEI